MRDKSLDIAKGICIIFVLMSHSCGFPYQIGKYCTTYFMASFFIISGYLQSNQKTLCVEIKRKVKKILVPYFLYNFGLYIMYALIEGFKSFRDAGWAFLGIFYSSYCLYFPISREDNIFFYRVYNNATWFFTAFFCASVLFLIYKELCLKKRQKIAVFILFILLTQTLSICPIFLPWNLDKAFIGANFMIIGYELKQYKVFEIQDFYIKICSTIFMIVIYVGLVNYNPEINLATREYGNRNLYSVVLYLLIGVIGTILCVWLSKLICPIPILGNVLAKLGSTTVPIISFHILLFHLLDGFVNRYVTESVLNSHYWEYGALKIGVTCLLILLAKCGVQFTKEEYKAKERQRIKYE